MSGDSYLPPHQPNCLGCGDENPGSMGLRLRIEDDRVTGPVKNWRERAEETGFGLPW